MVCAEDNIFEIGAVVEKTLRLAGWPREKRDAILKSISDAPSYDVALNICRKYITIRDED